MTREKRTLMVESIPSTMDPLDTVQLNHKFTGVVARKPPSLVSLREGVWASTSNGGVGLNGFARGRA